MIRGKATEEGTNSYCERYPQIQCNTLGCRQWQISPFGFGCYRISADVESHARSMAKALTDGINLIDTSTNYTDGGSETLVGQVLEKLIRENRLQRDQVVVVSKIGYLQGQNFALSQQRKIQGHPFPDLVLYGEQLEHCIHPEFIDDQLDRSLKRLQLETLDVLMLHNPEYYLSWAGQQGADLDEAREEFYGRVERAFAYFEQQVSAGRIQTYGISANTFVSRADDKDFVSLERVWQIANRISSGHHFRVIQLPMNLLESGAVLEQNQSGKQSVLSFASDHRLGVLVNRPLNAFDSRGLVRLAEPETIGEHSDEDVIRAIRILNKSETKFWRKLLPDLSLPLPLYRRIKEQAAVADQLKHYWRNFGTYSRWCQVRDGFLKPRIQGVLDYCETLEDAPEAIRLWLSEHKLHLKAAFRAVGSVYVAGAEKKAMHIKRNIANVESSWARAETLSQQALRALRSTSGISSVLVGMRRTNYVEDALQELQRPVKVKDRADAWRRLKEAL